MLYFRRSHGKGNAKQCKDAIFLAVGTGIGAGILINGNVLRGAHDIAGAIGWMALKNLLKMNIFIVDVLNIMLQVKGLQKPQGNF